MMQTLQLRLLRVVLLGFVAQMYARAACGTRSAARTWVELMLVHNCVVYEFASEAVW